jgi:hypothetical protein
MPVAAPRIRGRLRRRTRLVPGHLVRHPRAYGASAGREPDARGQFAARVAREPGSRATASTLQRNRTCRRAYRVRAAGRAARRHGRVSSQRQPRHRSRLRREIPRRRASLPWSRSGRGHPKRWYRHERQHRQRARLGSRAPRSSPMRLARSARVADLSSLAGGSHGRPLTCLRSGGTDPRRVCRGSQRKPPRRPGWARSQGVFGDAPDEQMWIGRRHLPPRPSLARHIATGSTRRVSRRPGSCARS